MSLYRVKDSEYLKKYRHGEKLDAAKVVYARHCHYQEKRSIRSLAREMAVSPSTMHDAIKSRTWIGVYPNMWHWLNKRKDEKLGWRVCRCAQCESERKKLEMDNHAT